MKKILNINEAIKVAKELRKNKKLIVLGGGCFDILHIGHIKFLNEAKKFGDKFILLLESDISVKKTKGEDRPINNQKDRAEILSALDSVDYIVLLPKDFKDNDYDDLLIKIKPDIIATTKDDKQIEHKKRQMRIVGAKLIEVINRVKDKSTSRLAKVIHKKFLL